MVHLTPFSQGIHLLSVGHLIVVVIRPITVVSSARFKVQGFFIYSLFLYSLFDDDIGAVCSCTVMCVQGVQEWVEDAALQCTSVEGQG